MKVKTNVKAGLFNDVGIGVLGVGTVGVGAGGANSDVMVIQAGYFYVYQ